MSLFKATRREVFVCTRLEELHQRAPRIPVCIENITCDNASGVRDFRDDVEVSVFRGFLEQGQVGVYATLDGKVVGHAWAMSCNLERSMANGYFELHKGESFIHFCNVKASCRRQGIYQAMLFALCKRLLNEAKVKRVFIDTKLGNLASVRGIQRVGFKPVGQFLYFQLVNRLIYRRSISK